MPTIKYGLKHSRSTQLGSENPDHGGCSKAHMAGNHALSFYRRKNPQAFHKFLLLIEIAGTGESICGGKGADAFLWHRTQPLFQAIKTVCPKSSFRVFDTMGLFKKWLKCKNFGYPTWDMIDLRIPRWASILDFSLENPTAGLTCPARSKPTQAAILDEASKEGWVSTSSIPKYRFFPRGAKKICER